MSEKPDCCCDLEPEVPYCLFFGLSKGLVPYSSLPQFSLLSFNLRYLWTLRPVLLYCSFPLSITPSLTLPFPLCPPH